MSWLARIEANADAVFEALQTIDARRGCNERGVDNYALHQLLWQCFPGEPDRRRDFLTRVDVLEGAYRLWVLSPSRPCCPDWCPAGGFEVKEIATAFLSHRYYAFDLRANPTKCLVQRNDKGERLRRGKRVPLIRPDELRDWIDRKGQAGGFRIVGERSLEIGPVVKNHFRSREHAAYHGGVQFRGVLEVTDQMEFVRTYYSGVGSAKGFGFGLLLLMPVNL
jgi:CRISPR system Cascade subunit CasE